jgi:hypothetical protein
LNLAPGPEKVLAVPVVNLLVGPLDRVGHRLSDALLCGYEEVRQLLEAKWLHLTVWTAFFSRLPRC